MAKRVCVIGAGPSGLASLRYLTKKSSNFEAIAFEQSSQVGGVWSYKENDGTYKHGKPATSPMYPDLVTNLPVQSMAFPGFPFPKHVPSFAHNKDIQKYLEDFSSKLSLDKFIQFNTKVIEVKPFVESSQDTGRWQVKDVTLTPEGDETEEQRTNLFDAVMICNGHYSVPSMPSILGMRLFKGDVKHSHAYRHPQDYDGKTVAILGGGLSALDIGLTLTSHAKQIYCCRSKDHPTIFPLLEADNLTNCPGITEIKESSMKLEDGKVVDVDAIILCTGYKFSFPFLTLGCHPKIKDGIVSPLYKHVIHADHPTLGFIGTSMFWPMCDMQARFFISSIMGNMVLPSSEEMKKEIKADYQMRQKLEKGFIPYHNIFPPYAGEYIKDLATHRNITPVPPVGIKILAHAMKQAALDFTKYTRSPMTYEVIDDKNFRVLKNEAQSFY